MIVRLIVVSFVSGLLTLVLAQPASADCHYVEQVVYVQGAAQVNTVLVCPGNTSTGDGNTPVGFEPPRDSDLDAICVQTAIGAGLDPFAFCDLPPDAVLPGLTPGIVAAAFQRLPLPPSELQVQPPNGRTLVNFDTNFFTESAPFDRSVTLLGQQVDLYITPSRFAWRFGDGEVVATAEPGRAYPHLDVTHSYLRKGRVQPSVDTTYTATYRINGGPWRAVPGSVTIAGPPVVLQVLTATPTLVGYSR